MSDSHYNNNSSQNELVSCDEEFISHTSAYRREEDSKDEREMVLTPWTVQNICYEVIKNYMMSNPPQKQGYRFAQTYDPDDLKTGIALEIAFAYKDTVVQKRPAIYVGRGDASYQFPTINQTLGGNAKESEKVRFGMVQMPINISVIATNVGFAEQLTEYVSRIFFNYQEVIKNDFCIRQLKLANISPPSLYLESKDHIVISITLLATFDLTAVIKGDDLKLKTVAYTIFSNCLNGTAFHQ
jgi:hypothetical protein